MFLFPARKEVKKVWCFKFRLFFLNKNNEEERVMRKLLVLLSAVAFVVAFTVPAMAADWGFYGSARMGTFQNDVTPAGLNPQSDDDLTWDLQGNSRIGADVKAGAIGGKFEYGTGINLRQLFGTWNFGGGTLLLGQTYTPLFYLVSNQVAAGDNDLVGYGGIYAGRQPMAQLAMGPLKIALVKPAAPAAAATVTGAGDVDVSLPKLEVAYSFKAGPFSLKPMLGYATYDEVIVATQQGYGIDSYILGLGFSGGFGAVSVKGSVYMGTNVGNYGFAQTAPGAAGWSVASNKVQDNDSMGYQLIVGFKASDMIGLEFGYGAVESELDAPGVNESDASSYYVNAVINLAKGVMIIPEIGKFDKGETTTAGVKTENGDTTYFGAKWQINF
jgi:hypothetical protein